MQAGDTFLLLDVLTHVHHLYVILSDPNQSQEQIYCAMVSTRGDGKEESCILHAGEHPFVKHDSVMVYKMPPAVLESLAQLNLWKEKGLLKFRHSVASDVLERIHQGYVQSRYCTDRVYQLLARQGLVD